MPETTDQQEKTEMKASLPHAARKKGGPVSGMMAMSRPDRPARRANGGATSDANPLSSAGKMSRPAYEKRTAPADDHGAGRDRD